MNFPNISRVIRFALVVFALAIFFQACVTTGGDFVKTQSQIAEKLKLAVLKITYDAFSDEEKERVNQSFYKYLAQDERMTVITEAETRKKFIPLGIDPSEITSEAGYITAGQVLQVDYVLIGNMDKIGDFVEVTFRTFKMPRGTQKIYPGVRLWICW